MPAPPARERPGPSNRPAGGRWPSIFDQEHLSLRCRAVFFWRKNMRIDDFERFSRIAIDEATAEHKMPTEPIPILTPVKLAHLVALLAAGKENIWYNSGDWQAVRDAVKRIDHECIICKAAGGHSATRYVHHVKHLRDRPDLALSVYDPDTGERQLICVCKQCHELLHPESQRQYRPSKPPVTAERWD